MTDDPIESIIDLQVKTKVSELTHWQEVRYEGGRRYYETTRILNEINSYDLSTKILYLEKLLNSKFIIHDNLPHSAPDITPEFKNGIQTLLASLKIQQINSKIIKPDIKSLKKRPIIPYKVKTLLQKEINSECPFCKNEDVDHFQIHHIDNNPENNQSQNLLMLCPTCHSKITKNDISHAEVLKMKNSLSI